MKPQSTPIMPPERGTILVFFAILLVPLLTVAGLAIDAGNLYRARLALQTTADATALAAVNYITMRGKIQFEKDVGIEGKGLTAVEKQTEINNYLRNKNAFPRDLARGNMHAAGLPHIPDKYEVTVEPNYIPGELADSSSAFDVQVTVSRPIRYFIMDVLPFFSDPPFVVRASARSRRRRAYAALMLDFSDSMGCPASGSCDCKDPPLSECPKTGRRYDKLIEAVVQFLKMFDLDRDYIYIAPFNSAAVVRSVKELKELNGTPDEEATEKLIDDLADYFASMFQPGGNTNVCDALMRTWEALRADIKTASAGQEVGYVLFTDGAPTAGRFLFKNVDGLPPYNNMGAYDYVHHSLVWKNGSALTLGPSMLFQSGFIGFNCLNTSPAVHCGLETDTVGAKLVSCGGITSAPEVLDSSKTAQAASDVFGPCLKDLESHLPESPTAVFGKEIPFADWRKLYYHCAVQLSDAMRTEKGVFYTVGLGQFNNAAASSDPYQDLADAIYRKDIFLSRVALDPVTSASFPKPDGKPVEFDYPGYTSLNQWNSSSPERQGMYFPTSDPNDLKLLFHKISLKLMLRLVS